MFTDVKHSFNTITSKWVFKYIDENLKTQSIVKWQSCFEMWWWGHLCTYSWIKPCLFKPVPFRGLNYLANGRTDWPHAGSGLLNDDWLPSLDYY